MFENKSSRQFRFDECITVLFWRVGGLCQKSSTGMYSLLVNTYHAKANSADDKLIKFFLFSKQIGSDTSCKLSPKETICMKCQILFSRKNKKNRFQKISC